MADAPDSDGNSAARAVTEVRDRTSDFDLGGWIYLNCAYQGPIPRVAETALATAAELRKCPARVPTDYFFSFPDAYRRLIAELVGADPTTISVTTSCTDGIMLLVNGLDWSPGDEVVIPTGEFPSNRLPWLYLERRGVTLREVAIGDQDPTAAIEAALTPRSRVVSLSWVGFSDGRRIDLLPISRLCADRGVLFAIDGSQGVGGLHLDLSETPCDLLASVGYKSLLGPYGLGFAYVEPSLAERLELANIGWLSMRGAEDFSRLAGLPLELTEGPRRFDANNTASFFNVAAGAAAARYLVEVTPREVERHVRGLLDYTLGRLPAGFAAVEFSPGEPRSNIVCLSCPDPETTAAALALLQARKIAVSAREEFIRLSLHIYNTRADMDALLEALRDAAAGERAPAARQPEAPAPELHRRLVEMIGL